MQNDVESSLLLDECRGHVASSRPSLCQSISSWVFLSHAHIRGVPVSDIWYDPFFAHDQNTETKETISEMSKVNNISFYTIISFYIQHCVLVFFSVRVVGAGR